MDKQLISTQKRIESIDIFRGIVMVIMAIDHLRDYLHIDAGLHDPLDLITTTPALFLTRWITHFCAPTFVFLSGVSIYLQSLRKTKAALSVFLIKRGIWLVFAEIFIVSLGFSFMPFYRFLFLQVIWSIGLSMIFLGLIIRLGYQFILALGLLIVLGHNLLDIPEAAIGFKSNLLWDLLHRGGFYTIFQHTHVLVFYPVMPWTGLLLVGYCAGVFFSPKYSSQQRQKILLQLGIASLVFFVVIRAINIYGDPHPWSVQKNVLYTVFSFIKVYKYPPSLLYMTMTIGVSLLLLAAFENVQNIFTRTMKFFGRTAFFYYILHCYVAHAIGGIFFFSRGHSFNDALVAAEKDPFLFGISGEGCSLGVVYLVWVVMIALLYQLCKKYDRYKTEHRGQWWFSYL